MNFTKEWALDQIEKRKAERRQETPAPGDRCVYCDEKATVIINDTPLCLECALECVEETPDPGPESDLQRKVLNYCEENGWACWHDRSKKVNEPGWPDNIIFLPEGKVVLIELKSSAGKFRKEQHDLRRLLGWNDHVVYIARSFKRVVEIIQRALRGK